MAFKEATDTCAGDATKYGAPDVKKIAQLLNGNAIDCNEPVLPRDTIFSISDADDTSSRVRFTVCACIPACTTRVYTLPNVACSTIITCPLPACSNTQELWVGAGSMVGTTTCGACFSSRELATNDVMISVMAFDTCMSESAQFTWTPPLNWDGGTMRFKAYWTHMCGAACQNFRLDLAGRAYANGCAIDQATGTAMCINDVLAAGCAACDMLISGFSCPITIGGGPVAGEPIIFKLSRDTTCDNLGGDAELIGIILEYGIDAVSTT